MSIVLIKNCDIVTTSQLSVYRDEEDAISEMYLME